MSTDLSDFFDGANLGREDSTPAGPPRHAATAPDVVDRVMTGVAAVSVAMFSAFIAGIFAGWWLT